MWGIIIFVVIIFIIFSTVVGENNAPKGGGGSNSNPCAECDADFAWYGGLSRFRKIAYSGWWLTRRISCASKGCF